ncbi:hypothetical protein ASG40_02385 [Methylobacterium sp. Leaf399]|uniref:hypothetical protein n=1 Tax=unclassified Methylobacterium TaxID=2615210 RepID=UPI0006F8E177|nr:MULTISPECIES: hypothetical protein [unclassified Methylobacterium]KQT19695.1 hypothetical protein ASG40_02385 [Methylobacterium sp. Leaf399]KQT80745.1 hypothetical protein ASG59_04805 [Methylobacterium sp. Leaf466]
MTTPFSSRRNTLGLLALSGSLLVGFVALPQPAVARNNTAVGVGTGAVAGALVAGPLGAVVGGIVGGVVGSNSESARPRRSRRARAVRPRRQPAVARIAPRAAPAARPVAQAEPRPVSTVPTSTTWTNPR